VRGRNLRYHAGAQNLAAISGARAERQADERGAFDHGGCMKNAMTVVATLAALATGGWAATAAAQAPKDAEKPAAAAAPAAGAAGGAPMMPKPAPENDVIKTSAGNWSCQGAAKGPDGQEMKFKSSWAVKPILGGHWFGLVYKRAKMGPVPAFEGNATVGYDTAQKKYVFIGWDNTGGWINLSSKDGAAYSGDGGSMGKVIPVKFNFTQGKDKKGEPSDKLFDVAMDFSGASSTESCKK
jgi:hypothetical protein